MEEIKMECEHCEQLFLASELMRDSIGRMVCADCKIKIEGSERRMKNENCVKIRDIVECFVKENGYDGLYSVDRCACKLDNLMHCDEFRSDCEAGFFIPEDDEEFDPAYEFMIGPTNFKSGEE